MESDMKLQMESQKKKKSPYLWYIQIQKMNSLSRILVSLTTCKEHSAPEVCHQWTLEDLKWWQALELEELSLIMVILERLISQQNNYHKVLWESKEVKLDMDPTSTQLWTNQMKICLLVSDLEEVWMHLEIKVPWQCIDRERLSRYQRVIEEKWPYKTMLIFDNIDID